MNDDKYRTLRNKLDCFHDWPCSYTFKFIVPVAQLSSLEAVFEGFETSARSSSKGKWVSLTCVRVMDSPEAVIEVYRQVEGIEGSFAL